MSHTPAPWTAEGSLVIKFGEDGRAICLIADSRGETTSDVRPIELDDPDWKTGMKNARLIAAAPELLDALENTVFFLDRVVDGTFDREDIRRQQEYIASITKKARGE